MRAERHGRERIKRQQMAEPRPHWQVDLHPFFFFEKAQGQVFILCACYVIVIQHKAISTCCKTLESQNNCIQYRCEKLVVDMALIKPIHPFGHCFFYLAVRPRNHWTMDLSGPVQYINQTCYLLPN